MARGVAPQLHPLDKPGPRLTTGLVGGFLAGVAFIALNSWFGTGGGASDSPLAVFTLVSTMAPGGTSIWVGMALHAALSAFFGMLLAAFTALVRGNGMLIASGLLFGGIIYVINFQVLARFVGQFAAFRATNQPFEVACHLVFGALTALFLIHPPKRISPTRPSMREEVPREPSRT